MSAFTISSPTSATQAPGGGPGPEGSNSQPQYDPAVGSALKSLVDQYGGGLVGEPGRLRGLLQDECPRAKREISVLLQALDERIPQDLMRVQSGEPIRSLAPRLARRLEEEKAMSGDASRWAVQTWAQGLGIVTPPEVHAQLAGGGAGAAFDNASVTFDDELPSRKSRPQDQVVQGDRRGGLVQPPVRPSWVKLAALGALAIVLLAGTWFGFMQPKIDITGVEPSTPLVGNGNPIVVQLSYEARRAPPQSIEVRFVRGDVNWKTEPTIINIANAAESGSGRLPAGQFSLRTAKPAQVTFAYTLVASNGQRNAPFERTFDIAPPPAITQIGVPRGLVVGQGFDLDIHFARGDADIAKIERHVVTNTGAWGSTDNSQELNYGSPSGNFNYHFDPFTQAMNSTLEFTLVDAAGVRSDPYRVVLNVGSAAAAAATVAPPPVRSANLGTVVGVREVHQQGQSTGIGAGVAGVFGAIAGHQTGHGRGRDLMTGLGALAGALAGNEAEKYVRGTSTWEVTVRLDNGSVRTSQQTSAWRVGQRVRLNGNSLEAM